MAKKDSQITSYRTFFASDAGKRVLGDILAEAGMFDTDVKTPEEMAVLNFAKTILKKMGLCGEREPNSWLSVNNIGSFIQKLSELPIEKG